MHLYKIDENWFMNENCLICGSTNHILMPQHMEEADAWECWACSNRWWIDDMAKTLFIINNNVDADIAEDRLCNADPSIIFVFGQPER